MIMHRAGRSFAAVETWFARTDDGQMRSTFLEGVEDVEKRHDVRN